MISVADDADKAPGKAKIPVFIGKFDVIRPFDAQACKGAGKAVQKEIAKAFGKSKKFEVVSASPKERGFDISGAVQKLEYDSKKGMIYAKIHVVLAETPGRAVFCNVPNDGDIDSVKPNRIEQSVESLLTTLAETAGANALRECERRAAK